MVQDTQEEKEIYRKGYYGFLMCIIGPIIFAYFPNLMEFIIQQNIRLTEGSAIVENWANPPMGIYAQVYMFNITNPAEVPRGQPPVLSEVGPFILRIEMSKNVTRWNTDDGTVEYKQKMTFFTEEKLSDESGNQPIYVANLAAIGATGILGNLIRNFFGANVFNMAMSREVLMQKTTVRTMLVDGLQVKFLAFVSGILGRLTSVFNNILKNGALNILHVLNNSAPESYVAATGYNNLSMGLILKFKGNEKLNTWGNEYCDKINGSEGVTFKYPVKRKIQYFFLAPFCRSMRLDYMGNDDVFGIPTKKFFMDSMFISPRYIKANKCFCPETDYYCKFNGTLPLGKCMFGLPLFYSKPHFFGADPIFHEMVKGLEPDADKHQSYFHINTMLAMPLQVRVCLQINMKVTPIRGINILRGLKSMLLPVAWINITAGIMGTGHEWKIYFLLVGPPFLAKVVGVVVTCVGIIRLSKALFLPLRKRGDDVSSTKVYPIDDHLSIKKEQFGKIEKF